MEKVSKVLIVRNDKLGDFILSLPSFALVKQHLPNIKTVALVPQYTAEIATASPWIDEILIDNADQQRFFFPLAKQLSQHKFSSVITLFSSLRVALACWWARIPYRIAPATKIAQIFYNHRLLQHRSHSSKPEYEYNLDVAQKFLTDHGIEKITPPQAPYILLEDKLIAKLRSDFMRNFDLAEKSKLAFIHVGSGGSAHNLTISQYVSLARHLHSNSGHIVVLTAGPDELSLAQSMAKQLQQVPHVIYHSTEGLLRFTQHIAFSDIFISGSTGPLHLAGALDVPTAAFYPLRKSATALRWQTLNSAERRLAYSPPAGGNFSDLTDSEIKKIAHEISQRYLN